MTEFFGNKTAAIILFIYLPVAFTLIVTYLNHRNFLKKRNDYAASLLYFFSFFLCFMIVPCLVIFFAGGNLPSFLPKVGLTLGNAKRGAWIAAAAIPLGLLSAFIGSKDSKMKNQYPLSKQACTSLAKFIIFEAAYLLLYYVTWEFLYRGLLFFPLISLLGLVPALSIQTIISTLHHIGHPDSEVIASLAAGFLFGLIAYWTGSFLYTIFIHALIGIGNDTFLYLRYYRKGQS